MKKNKQTFFYLVEMIKVTCNQYMLLEPKLPNGVALKMKRKLSLLFIVLSNSFVFAQVPNISYTGVQNNYTINNAISPLAPSNIGGIPIIRTNVSSIAGSGASGYLDGTTASPKYYSPTGVAVAASGNMYIADSQNHCVRKISATGLVSTFAGTGVAGFANGVSNVAQFNIPYSIAVDASENVYVTESTSFAVRKITQAGVVSTFAGNATTSGFMDGFSTIALFSSPKGLAVDALGNVYVADGTNNRIRKISSSGTVTTVAGDGTAGYLDGQGTTAKFNNPIGVAVTTSGLIYVSDTSNNRIRAISNTGLVTTFAGSGTPGIVNAQGTAAQFNAPRALAIDGSGNLCVVDYNNNCIRKIASSGLASTLSGTGGFGSVNGIGSIATFKYPEGIGFDQSGNAFVADVTNNCIRKITTTGDTSTYSGTSIRGLENGQGGAMATFNNPVAVALTSTGITYIIDDLNFCVRKVTADGIVSTLAGNAAAGYVDGQGSAAYFNGPKGIAVDTAGNIYVADTYNNRIRKITSAGVVTTIAGDGTVGYLDGQGTAAKFNNPYGLTVDSAGNIYVADTKNHRIRKISSTGLVTTVAGFILSGYVDGASTVARFKNPQGIAIDNATGILYVVDTTNNRIRKIATDGTVSTFVGSNAGYGDGQGISASFNGPIGITIDGLGNLYVGDYYNSVIRKIDSAGLVSTYAGNGISQFLDGIGNVASFYYPVGVATDTSGNIYVADSYTQRIRKITSIAPYTISPTLPVGISFNTTNGVLSGTPTEIKATTIYTIGASNYSGTSTTNISFETGNSTAPTAPIASAQTFCTSASIANLVATGTALKWYNVPTGGIALASSTALATGNYYVSQTVSSIESARTTVAVTINTTVAPTASAQTFCNSATVANLVATGTTLKWYNVASGGAALASTIALASGNYYVSQTLNSCESSRTVVAVSINITVAPTASAQTFCTSATVANLVATGTSLKWYNVASGGTSLLLTTALASGNYYVSQTLNSCESSRTMVAVTIYTTLAPSASAQTFNNSAFVSNLVASGTALQWYNAVTGGIALSLTTVLASGNYYVSQTLNSCESSRTLVAVIINFAPGAPTASAQTFCNSGTVANLVATGTLLQWYNVATGGAALSSTTALVTGNYFVSQTVSSIESARTTVAVTVNTTTVPTASAQIFCNSGSVASLVATGSALKWYNVATGGTALVTTTALSTGNYYVSQTLNSCESLRTLAAVTINITAAPIASARTFCNSATVANLVATGTSLRWYNVSTGGTALSSTTALSTGDYYVSQTLNSCESSRTAVAVSIVTTALPTVSAQAFCNSGIVANLVATGTSLQWYNVATGGSVLQTTTSLSTGNYYVSQSLNSCESARATVAVTINTTAPPTASAQTFNNSVTVSNLVATGTSLQWYNVATGGIVLSLTTAVSTGNYYVSQTLNSCESSRTAVLVTVNIPPIAPTASAQTFCNSATVTNLVATGTSLKWYNVATGGAALASTAAVVTGNYYVSQTVNSIESARTMVAVTVNITTVPTASAQTLCNSATVANLVAMGTTLKWYNIASGGSSLLSTTALTSGNYYVSQTLNSCESQRILVTVIINTTVAPSSFAQTFNNAATVADLVATGTLLKWYNISTGGTALASATTLVAGNYYVSQTLNSCESARTAVVVTINTAPLASSQTFCGSGTVAGLVATGTALKWYNVSTGGTALPSTTAVITGNYYVSQTVNSVESQRTLVVVTVFSTPIGKGITSPTSSGSALAPICTQDIKVLNVKAGYSATTIQWERAVVALNSTTAPPASAYSPIAGATGPSYTVTNAVAGKNYFRARFINGNCIDKSVITAALVYYKDCSIVKLSVSSYPSPFSETFNLSLVTSNKEKVGVVVYDMTGRLIEKREVNFDEISEIKLGDFYPSGIYNIVVSQGEDVKTTRVVKR